MPEPFLILKPDREKSVLRRHPWVFSGAVARLDGVAAPGDTVIIRAANGDFLARAAYSPKSQIIARLWSWQPDELINPEFLTRRIERAVALREPLTATTNAMRLVNAESDGIPGLIADRYDNFIVTQFLTAGTERWKNEIAEILLAQPGVVGIYERSDVEVRGKEGLKSSEGPQRGALPPELIEIWEQFGSDPADRVRFAVDVINGHKTGFYLDQRENRKVVSEFARRHKTLNLFSYTGSFTIEAERAGASSTTSIDSSGPSITLARHNLELNNLPTSGLTEADVFKALREYRDSNETFDLIILDPPKFAHTEAQINKATRAYKDLNWLACRLLNPGGYLITFSCSGLVSEDLFQKILFGAALDAGRDVQIIRRLGQASDHPVLLSFPEAAYLKGFVCQVL
jgi:23S rRNA (cytosine1962-C5)-methyltransferase